jgi:hypothetical protein
MIRFIIITAFTFFSIEVFACKCAIHTLKEEVALSDHIFIGRVIKRTESDKAYYFIIISEVFKGEKTDTITIQTGFGGTDCGMEFIIGKEYLVYAKQNSTSRCRRNALALNNPDIEKLRRKIGAKVLEGNIGEVNIKLNETRNNLTNQKGA